MKVRTKLYLSSVVIVALIGVLVLVTFISSNIVARENEKLELASDVYLAISELDLVMYEYFLHREKRMEDQWDARYNSIAEILEKASAEDKEEFIAVIYDRYIIIGDMFLQVRANNERKQELIQEEAPQDEIDANSLAEERLISKLLVESQAVFSDISVIERKTRAEVVKTQEFIRSLNYVLLISLVIVATITLFLVARSISRPIRALHEGTEIIKKGDLDYQVGTKSQDEIGQLSRAFDEMTTSLKKSRSNIERKVADRTAELEKLNKYMVGRELKMKELKDEIERLKKELKE